MDIWIDRGHPLLNEGIDSFNTFLLTKGMDALLDALEANDAPEATKGLARLTLDDLDDTALYLLLAMLLRAARVHPAMVKRVIDAFAESNPTEQKISTFSQLWIHMQCELDLLRDVATALPDYTHDEVVIELMQFDNNPILTVAMERLAMVYGKRSYLEAEILYRQATDAEADRIADYFFKVMREQAGLAAVPPWIRGDGKKSHATLVTEADKIMKRSHAGNQKAADLSDAELAEQLVAGLAGQGASISDIEMAREVMRSQLAVATPADREAFLKPLNIISSRQLTGEENKKIFERVGPVNLLNDANLLGPDVCARFGGCRMLLCNCFERDASRAGISYHTLTDDPEDEPYEDETADADWFLKRSCQICGNGIRSRAHALRRPLTGGGWQGCYCSIGCLKGALSKEDRANGVSKLLITRVLEQIEAIGILDRRPEPVVHDQEEEDIVRETLTRRHAISFPRVSAVASPATPNDEFPFPTQDEFERGA